MKAASFLSSVLGVTMSAVLCGASMARAEEPGFAFDTFNPAERGSDWFANESLDLRGTVRSAAGITYDWAYAPYVLDGGGAEEETRVLTDRMVVHVGGTVVLLHRLRIGVNVPVVVFQHGDDLAALPGPKPAPSTPAFGDIRLGTDLRVFGVFGEVITGALGVQAFFPTGSQEQLTSDGTMRLLPRAILAGHLYGAVYSVYGGFHFRPLDESVLGRHVGSELAFGTALGVKVNDIFVFGPELIGSTAVAGEEAFQERTTPLELLLGFHVVLGDDFRVGSSIGPGLSRGDGSPTLRVTVAFEYARDYCVDKDGDGICEYRDACPEVAGVRNFRRSINGCPIDRDRDGFIDLEDKCPEQKGIKTGDPDTTGCPDRDGDGVPDKIDACPAEAGTTGDDEKTKGCPKKAPAAQVQGPEVQTSKPIRFTGATDDLDPATVPVLQAVAKLLIDKPDLHVAIIAHVVGPEATAELAERRARVVKNWLENHGVESERLFLQGPPDPTAPPPKEERIELRVIEQPEPPGPLFD